MKIAQLPSIFGTISPPQGSPIDLGLFIGRGINLVLIVASLFMLAFMLWGAFEWITSGGEKEKMEKARNKITQSVFGIFIIILSLSLFLVLTGNILNIIEFTPNGWKFNLPNLSQPTPIKGCSIGSCYPGFLAGDCPARTSFTGQDCDNKKGVCCN